MRQCRGGPGQCSNGAMQVGGAMQGQEGGSYVETEGQCREDARK